MCGIYGIFSRYKGGLSSFDLGALKQMAIVTSLRGDHSSGFAALYNNTKKAPWVVRSVGDPFNLFFRKEVLSGLDKMVTGASSSMGIFGHGRYATKGAITVENAHPFTEGKITLVHNGTIASGVDMSATADNGEAVEVDSHALAIAMDKEGIAKALCKVNGAFAVIVHNQEDGCIYFARNKERPLCWYKSHGKLYIMSEVSAMNFLLDRSTTITQPSTPEHKIGLGVVSEFEVMKLYKYDPVSCDLYMVEDLAEMRREILASAAPFRNQPKKSEPWKPTENGGKVKNYTEGKGYQFKCNSIEKALDGSNEYIYHLELEGGEAAIARSSLEDTSRVGQLGWAQTLRHRYTKGERGIAQAKFTRIMWYDVAAEELLKKVGEDSKDVVDAEEEEDGAQTRDYQVSRNHVYVTRKGFSSMECKCGSCDKAVGFDEVPEMFVTAENQLLCEDCNKTLEIFKG